ncbi:MAG: rod shape-determining protein MreC [Patescibacteria group bacterium]|nr:rod shape-determining protein MreC [Patescibacteria group bacterium]
MPIPIKYKNIFFIIGVVVILLVLLHGVGVLKPVENATIWLLNPVQKAGISFTTSIKNFFNNFVSIEKLQKENKDLKKEINKLTIENNYLKTLFEENKIISSQVEELQKKNYSYVFSRVISRGVDPTFKTMVINRGTNSGIKKNMPVVTEKAILIGKIAQVEKNSAQVMLLNDVRSKTAAQIQNEELSEGLITGEFGLTLKMDLIPKQDQINVGQSVVTSGLENSIPKGLLIGEIKSIKKQSGDFFQLAFIESPINYDHVQIVSVLTKY